MSALLRAPPWIRAVCGIGLALIGVWVGMWGASALTAQTDSEATGTVIWIVSGTNYTYSDIEFEDSDGRRHDFRSQYRADQIGETVQVRFDADDPSGTAATQSDRDLSMARVGLGVASVVGGLLLAWTGLRDGRLNGWTHSRPAST